MKQRKNRQKNLEGQNERGVGAKMKRERQPTKQTEDEKEAGETRASLPASQTLCALAEERLVLTL